MTPGSASATAPLSVAAAAALRVRQPYARAPAWAASSRLRQQQPLLKLKPCASLAAAAPPVWRAESDGVGGGADSGDVMGLLLRERIVFLGNEIEDFLADAVVSQLLLLDAIDPESDIRLFVNSPGGSLRSNLSFHFKPPSPPPHSVGSS
jgi:ATP-dependent Clp protease, protease subunit